MICFYQKLFSLLFLLILTSWVVQGQEFESILSGKELSGWHVQIRKQGVVANEDQSVFVWKGNKLHVYPKATGGTKQPFAALITNNTYKNYHLRVEYKWGKDKFQPRDKVVRDAGIIFHVFDTVRFWAKGIEYQVQEGDTGDAWFIGCAADVSVNKVMPRFHPKGKTATVGKPLVNSAHIARSYFWERPGWNLAEIIVKEDTAEYYLNGHLINAWTNAEMPVFGDDGEVTWQPLNEGRILLQAEGAEVFYRKVEIKRL